MNYQNAFCKIVNFYIVQLIYMWGIYLQIFAYNTHKCILNLFCIYCMFASIGTTDCTVTLMLSGKRFIPIEQMIERYLWAELPEIPILNWHDQMLVSLVCAPTPAFLSESKIIKPVQVLQQDGPLHQLDQSCTAWVDYRLFRPISAGHHGKLQGLTSQVQVTGTLVIFMQRYLVQFDIRQRCTQYYLWQSR